MISIDLSIRLIKISLTLYELELLAKNHGIPFEDFNLNHEEATSTIKVHDENQLTATEVILLFLLQKITIENAQN